MRVEPTAAVPLICGGEVFLGASANADGVASKSARRTTEPVRKALARTSNLLEEKTLSTLRRGPSRADRSIPSGGLRTSVRVPSLCD